MLRVADYPAFLGTNRIRFVKSVVRACRHFSFSICSDGREKRKREKEILCKASAGYFHEVRMRDGSATLAANKSTSTYLTGLDSLLLWHWPTIDVGLARHTHTHTYAHLASLYEVPTEEWAREREKSRQTRTGIMIYIRFTVREISSPLELFRFAPGEKCPIEGGKNGWGWGKGSIERNDSMRLISIFPDCLFYPFIYIYGVDAYSSFVDARFDDTCHSVKVIYNTSLPATGISALNTVACDEWSTSTIRDKLIQIYTRLFSELSTINFDISN